MAGAQGTKGASMVMPDCWFATEVLYHSVFNAVCCLVSCCIHSFRKANETGTDDLKHCLTLVSFLSYWKVNWTNILLWDCRQSGNKKAKRWRTEPGSVTGLQKRSGCAEENEACQCLAFHGVDTRARSRDCHAGSFCLLRFQFSHLRQYLPSLWRLGFEPNWLV